MNQYNSQCLSAGAQSCGRWSDCNKSQAQTRADNQILNVYAQACDPTNPAQVWTLGPAPNSTLIDFTPLNVSAARYPSPNTSLALEVSQNSPKVSMRPPASRRHSWLLAQLPAAAVAAAPARRVQCKACLGSQPTFADSSRQGKAVSEQEGV